VTTLIEIAVRLREGLTVVAVAAEAVGGVDVVQRRRPVVPELDVVGPRAEAAQVVAGVRGQQVLHRRRRVAEAPLEHLRRWRFRFAAGGIHNNNNNNTEQDESHGVIKRTNRVPVRSCRS
jgi:hypothetical protein